MVRGEYSIKVKPSIHSPKTYLLHLLFLHQQYPQKDNIYSVVHPICQASCLIYAATRRWTGKFWDEDGLAHFQYPEKICIPTPSPLFFNISPASLFFSLFAAGKVITPLRAVHHPDQVNTLLATGMHSQCKCVNFKKSKSRSNHGKSTRYFLPLISYLNK